MTRIPYDVLQSELKRILLSHGFNEQGAADCAAIFANNSMDGVYSHGLNRFGRFIEYLNKGLIDRDAEPEMEFSNGFTERWNGNLAPGMLNARFCMDRAISLQKKNGLSCVSVRNTNHWMRGGTYGWQAADAGCIGICFTNTTALVPPWGGVDPRLGNNPIVIAVPRAGGHIVLDMALSQYSGGQLESHVLGGKQLAVYGGYDTAGNLTTDPQAIFDSKRFLPVGFWKGSGLALMLDLLAAVLSKGSSTKEITRTVGESGVSQVFMCFHSEDAGAFENTINGILEYTKSSTPDVGTDQIYYPGEKTLITRKENTEKGIPVNDAIWQSIQKM